VEYPESLFGNVHLEHSCNNKRNYSHQLNKDIERWTRRTLKGSPTVSPVTAALCGSEPLCTACIDFDTFFEHFFSIVPSTPSVSLKTARQNTYNSNASKQTAYVSAPKANPTNRGTITARRPEQSFHG
jgi:hypothetical protein